MTLTETAYYTRKSIKYGILFVLFLIVGRLAWEVGFGIYRNFVPEAPPAPTVKHGKLPQLPFTNLRESTGLTFSLQIPIPTGELPTLPTIANVYFMPQRSSALLNLEEVAQIIRALNFNPDGQGLTETIYRYSHPQDPVTIDMDIVTRAFSLSYNLAQTPDIVNYRPESAENALRTVTSFLSLASLYPEDLETGQKTYEFLSANPPNFSTVSSLSEANFVRVNLFRANYDEMLVLTPDKTRSNVWFLVAGNQNGSPKIIAGEYHYFPVDIPSASTYPLKTSEQAWEELKGGRAFVVSGQTQGDVVIRRIYIAYYDSGQPQGFLQPIVVFEGDQNFTAYLPAVTDEYYGGN